MTNAEAIELIRNLGNIFVTVVQEQSGKKPKSTSPLMNGLVAYEYLKLKGEREDLDEAIDIVVRIVYETVVEQIEADTIRIGRD
jgi:hypothetical protein